MRQFRNIVFFLGVSLLLYAVSLKGMFVFDDYKVIVQNEFIHFLSSLTYLWEYDATRFLPNVTFAINFALNGLNPLGYHLVNVLLHGLNAWLVFLLIKSLDIFRADEKQDFTKIAFLTAIFFLVHPVQTQSVSYIVQRSTLMMATAFLLAVFAFIKSYRSQGRHSHWLWYCLSLVAAMAGAFCKPSMVALPFMLIMLGTGMRQKGSKFCWRAVLRIIPFFIIIVLVAWNLWVLKNSGVGFTAIAGVTRQTTEISRMAYFSTQMNVIMHYIFLLLCPLWLNLDYDFPISDHIFSFPTWISLIAIAALLFFAVRWWKKNKLVSFGFFWFFIALLPESSVFPLSDVVFEHRLYLPMVGFSVILASVLMKIPSQKVWAGVLIIVVAVLSGLTVARNVLWADPQALLLDTITKSPYRLRPIYNLESEYLRIGNLEGAKAMLDKAFAIAPEYPATHFKMGSLLLQLGKEDEASQHFSKGTQASQPLIAAASAWRAGSLAEKQGRPKEAEDLFLRSIKLDPRNERSCIDLGNLYNTQGRYSEAKAMYAKAVHISPFNPHGYNGLATVHVMEGDVQKGIEIYQKALQLLPEEKILQANLAKTYLIQKDYIKAGKEFAKMVEKYPDDVDIWYHLGLIHFYMGNQRAATQVFQKLAVMLREKGLNDQADQIIARFLTPQQAAVAASQSEIQ